MKYVIRRTQDISGKDVDIGVIELEKDEVVKVRPSIWGVLVYDNEMVPFFSRMVRKFLRCPETLADQATKGKDSEEEKITPGEISKNLFRTFSIFLLDILAWVMYRCGVRMIPYSNDSGDDFWFEEPEICLCVVSDVSADTDYVSVKSPEAFISWRKVKGKKIKWLDKRIGDRKNGILCRVYSGEGQVALIMARNCREISVEDGTAVMISRILVIAFIGPAGVLPEIKDDCAVFPAGFRLFYVPVEDRERSVRLGRARKSKQPLRMEVHNLGPQQ